MATDLIRKLKRDCSLLHYNTFGIKANAAVLIEYDSIQELTQVLEYYRNECSALPLLHIGGGSNLLFVGDYPGMVLFSRIKGIEVVGEENDEILIRAGAGMVFDDFVEEMVSRGWYGLENLSLIPGQVGAAAVQNIGAYGAEACQRIETVEGLTLPDGKPFRLNVKECQYGYRQSIFKQELRGRCAITHVTWRLSRDFHPQLDYNGVRQAIERAGLKADTLTAQELRRIIIRMRREKLPDPIAVGNAGSFFMNPVVERSVYERIAKRYPDVPGYPVDEEHVKLSAGWLIEWSGWKGRIKGKAAVHARQALIILNLGGATGSKILRLSEAIRQDVRQYFGVELKPEVEIIDSSKL